MCKPGEDEYAPDVLVVPPTDEDIRFTGTPLLAVEILSTNRSHDLVLKASKYAAAGLPRYWVVDPANVNVAAYTLGINTTWELIAAATGPDLVELDFGVGSVQFRPMGLLS